MTKYNIKRRHSKPLDLSTGIRYRPLSRRLNFGGILDYNGEEKGLGWNKASGDALKSSFSDVGSAISSVGSVVGGVTSIVDSAMKNAQIADTSEIESDIQGLKDETFSEATDSDSLLDAYNNINFQKADYTMQDVRGVSGGEMAMNTISAIGSGAAAGASVGGPWGCVCAGTRVITNDGRFVNIESLTETDGIVGYDKGTYCINDITLNEGEAYKECVRITLSNGTILECSVDHPIYSSAPGRAKRVTIDDFRKRIREFTYRNAEDLQIGDIVAILDSIPVFGSKSEPDAYLIGMLIGDGSYDTKHGTRLFTGDPSTWKFIEDNYNCSKTIESGDKYQKEFRTYKIIGFNRKLSDYGILGQSGSDKSLPQGIHEWDKESLSRFIAGLFDTDGYVTLDKPFKFRIAFCQSNYSLLSEVKELLLKFGIHSYIKKSSAKKTEYKGHAIKSKTSYVLVIKDILSTRRFIENISLNISYKKENLQKISDIIKIKKRRDNSYYDGIKAVKVRKIEPLGVRRIYNLEALSSHNYIANGIITHNSIAGAAVGLGGALAGIFTGNSKARKKAAMLNAAAKDANNRAIDTFDYQADSVMKDSARNAMKAAYAKDGGAIHIEKKNRGKFTASAKRAGMGVQEFARHVLANKDKYSPTLVKRANFARNASKWKHSLGGYMFEDGGNLYSDIPAYQTHGGDFLNGVTLVGAGGTHEDNPHEGVPMGIAPDGQLNLVEEGEVIFNDYVFSNRLHLTDKELKEASLPKKYRGYTFALAAEDLSKESSERPNDPISKRGLEDSMMKLAMVQEAQRAKKGKKGTQQMMALGGRKYSGLVPLEDDPYEGSKEQALEEAELEWLAKQDPQLREELQAIGSSPNRTLPTYLRYAPALGSAIGALTSVVQKPDYSNSNLILDAIHNLSRDKVRYRPISNYLTYKPLDRNYYLNSLQRQAAATRAALRNSGINPGQVMAGLLAADYNAQNAVGDTLLRMDMYNEQQRQAVEQFNRGTNQYNSQAAMNADAQNAQLAANRDRLRSQLITTAAGMKEASDTALEQSRSMNFTNLMDNLGMIGRENRDTNMLEAMKDSELFGVLNEATKRGWNKDGGMLTKRRNRRRR